MGFITGLSIGDLETAPSREQVEKDIMHFFGANTIIIGHNIGFDLDFLNKYFPSLTYHTKIDTMNLAQTIVHYTPSYALEVLIENLKSEKKFNDIFRDEDHGEEKSHDAFFDTKNSIKLFLYFVGYLYELIDTYTNLVHIIMQTESIRKEMLQLEKYKDTPKVKVSFPALEKISPQHTSIPK